MSLDQTSLGLYCLQYRLHTKISRREIRRQKSSLASKRLTCGYIGSVLAYLLVSNQTTLFTFNMLSNFEYFLSSADFFLKINAFKT